MPPEKKTPKPEPKSSAESLVDAEVPQHTTPEADPIMLSEYFTEESLGHELGITDRTLRRWEAERRGPPRTVVARRVYYRKSAFFHWLLSQEKPPLMRGGRRSR